MSATERALGLISAVGLAMVLVDMVLGKPTALLWARLALAATGSVVAQALFVLRHREIRL